MSFPNAVLIRNVPTLRLFGAVSRKYPRRTRTVKEDLGHLSG